MTQLSDADREFAQLLYDELEGPIANQDASRQMRQWETCLRLVPAARSARDAEREPEIAALKAENARLRAALEDIAIFGCGMLNQPIAMNAPEEVWLERRIREYERRARAALGGENG